MTADSATRSWVTTKKEPGFVASPHPHQQVPVGEMSVVTSLLLMRLDVIVEAQLAERQLCFFECMAGDTGILLEVECHGDLGNSSAADKARTDLGVEVHQFQGWNVASPSEACSGWGGCRARLRWIGFVRCRCTTLSHSGGWGWLVAPTISHGPRRLR